VPPSQARPFSVLRASGRRGASCSAPSGPQDLTLSANRTGLKAGRAGAGQGAAYGRKLRDAGRVHGYTKAYFNYITYFC
jgi:hypothetical protein